MAEPAAGRVLLAYEVGFARAALRDDASLDEMVMDSDAVGGHQAIYVRDLVRTLEVRLTPVVEVYERFRHLDRLLSTTGWEPDNEAGRICTALWAAVKRAMEGAYA